MMISVKNEIICKYTENCKSYSVHEGEGFYSKCLTCQNNTYVNPEDLKKDYYKPNKAERIENLIVWLICAIVIISVLALIFTTPGC